MNSQQFGPAYSPKRAQAGRHVGPKDKMKNRVILCLVMSVAVVCSCSGPANRSIANPTDEEIKTVFVDLKVKIPEITNAISIEYFQALKGNVLTLTIPEEPTLTNEIIKAAGVTNWNGSYVTIQSHIDKDYPWRFTFTHNTLSNGVNVIVMAGMQPYD